MDSTLIAIEFIDELADVRGVWRQVAKMTRGAMLPVQRYGTDCLNPVGLDALLHLCA